VRAEEGRVLGAGRRTGEAAEERAGEQHRDGGAPAGEGPRPPGPDGRRRDREQREALLVREAEDALGPAVGAERVEEEAEPAVDEEIAPEGGAVRRLTAVDAPERGPARPGDEREPGRLVELHRVRRTPVAAPREEAAEAADRVPHRHRDREVVGAAGEVEAAKPRERPARRRRAEEAAEEDEPDAEVGEEPQLAARVVLPAEDDEERLGAERRAEEHRPHGRPEGVLREPERLAPGLQPEDAGEAAGGGEEAVGGRHPAGPLLARLLPLAVDPGLPGEAVAGALDALAVVAPAGEQPEAGDRGAGEDGERRQHADRLQHRSSPPHAPAPVRSGKRWRLLKAQKEYTPSVSVIP
jgi:hypothetical protein